MSDRAFVNVMLKLPERLQADFFNRNHFMIVDDANYWNLLGTLWKLSGTVLQQDLWLPLFNSQRKRNHKIMKTRERRKFRRLPKTVTAYRAINNDGEINIAISWTTSRRVAEKVFSENGKRRVVKKTFDKSQIIAFFDRRGESEIIVMQSQVAN